MSYETEDKMVSHPDHYKSGKYEVIDIIDEFCKDLVGTECVCTANALKYILRWKKKNGIQDVKKAIWYLQHMVDIYEYAERDEKIVAETIEESFPTLHECFSCNDCKNDCPKDCPGIDDEPEPLNLRKNAAGVYIPEDHIEKGCKNCKYGDAPIDSIYCSECVNDGMGNPPTKWEPKKDIMNPPYDQLLSDFKEAKERLAAYEDDRRIKASFTEDLMKKIDHLVQQLSASDVKIKLLEEENSNLKFDLSEIANIMLKFLAQTDIKLVGRSEKGFVDISHECKSLSDKIHDCLAKYEMED